MMVRQMATYLGDELALAAYDMWVLHNPVRLTGAAFDQSEMGDVCLMALMVLAGAERRAEYDSDEGDGQWRASGAIPGVNRFEVLDDEDLQGQPPPPIWRYCEKGALRDELKQHLRGLAQATMDHLAVSYTHLTLPTILLV